MVVVILLFYTLFCDPFHFLKIYIGTNQKIRKKLLENKKVEDFLLQYAIVISEAMSGIII